MLWGAIYGFASTTEFRSGLLVGLALAVGVALVVAERPGRRVVPVAGLLIAAGFATGIAISSDLPVNVALGIACLAAGGWIAARLEWPPLASVSLALPGAVLLTTDLGSRPRWVVPVTVLAVSIASPLVADFDRRFGRAGWPLALYAISVVGVYFTVPDTERAAVLLGLALPFAFIGWPVSLASLGPAGSYAAVGVLLWVGAFESRGREAALVGAIACLALLVFEPIARVAGGGRDTMLAAVARQRFALIPIAILQLGLVFVASRIAGLRGRVSEAVVIVAFETIATVAALWSRYVTARR
jgi:hypothetical protein